MGSDLYLAAPAAQANKAERVYTALEKALKLKASVKRILNYPEVADLLVEQEENDITEFLAALDEAEKIMRTPLFG